MEFKKGASITTSDFWYDLFLGGYIKPKKLLADPGDIARVDKAIEILSEFYHAAEQQGVLEEM